MAYTPNTASEVLAQNGADQLDEERFVAAEAAGFAGHPERINYPAALLNYNNREDVEALAARRAREVKALPNTDPESPYLPTV